MKNGPEFKNIKSYDEFKKYYWYLSELKQICKTLDIEYVGGKLELNNYIQQYFFGIKIPHKAVKNLKKFNESLSLDTIIYNSGFACRPEYKPFFAEQTGNENFHYNANMVAAVKKARLTKDENFSVKDLIDVYTGKNTYAVYDKSSCQWNAFVKAFCADEKTKFFKNKLKAAAALWTIVRETDREKIYDSQLLIIYKHELEKYKI